MPFKILLYPEKYGNWDFVAILFILFLSKGRRCLQIYFLGFLFEMRSVFPPTQPPGLCAPGCWDPSCSCFCCYLSCSWVVLVNLLTCISRVLFLSIINFILYGERYILILSCHQSTVNLHYWVGWPGENHKSPCFGYRFQKWSRGTRISIFLRWGHLWEILVISAFFTFLEIWVMFVKIFPWGPCIIPGIEVIREPYHLVS